MIILVGILAGLPKALAGTVATFDISQVANLAIFALLGIATIYFVVYISEGQRNIPIAYAGRGGNNRLYSGQSNNLPLRVNQAGVIPIIFALSLLLFPGLIASFFANARTPWIAEFANNVTQLFSNQTFYGILYFLLVVFFTYFYTANVSFKVDEVAENLKNQNGFILGIRPGKKTEEYLEYVVTRVLVLGSAYLAAVCLLPEILISRVGIPFYFGGTSVLIVVSVTMDTINQIQSHLLAHQYEGLIEKSNLRGKKRPAPKAPARR